MRQDVADIKQLSVEMNCSDQSVFVSANIKDVTGESSVPLFYLDQVECAKRTFQVGWIVEPALSDGLQPGIQRCGRVGVFSTEVAKLSW